MTISQKPQQETHEPLPPPRVRRRYRTPQPQPVEPRGRVSSALIYIIVAGLITAVGLLYLFQTNHVAGLGFEMSQLQREREALALRNEELNYAIARYESLSVIEGIALGQLEMQPADDHIFLTVPRPPSDELEVPEPVEPERASLPERIWQAITGKATAVSADQVEERP